MKSLTRKKLGVSFRRYLHHPTAARNHPIRDFVALTKGDLRVFFEAQFTAEMSWESFPVTWDLGHIVPQHLFNHIDAGDMRECWNWINLLPLPPRHNKLWGGSIEWALQELERRKTLYPHSRFVYSLIHRIKKAQETLQRPWSTLFYQKPLPLSPKEDDWLL